MTEDEEFFAWLDGELDEGAAARVEARVAADRDLQLLANDHRAMRDQLRSAFDPVMTAPPGRGAADAPRAANDNRRWAGWAAMAASLALAFVLGTQVPEIDESLVAPRGDMLVAQGSLDEALDVRLASAPTGGTRIGLTFRDGEGRLCRSFRDPAATGVACREGEHWAIEGLFPGTGDEGEIRMASGGDRVVGDLIDRMIVGEPLDAEAEAAARNDDWR